MKIVTETHLLMKTVSLILINPTGSSVQTFTLYVLMNLLSRVTFSGRCERFAKTTSSDDDCLGLLRLDGSCSMLRERGCVTGWGIALVASSSGSE